MRYTITALLLAGLILSCREDDQSTLPSHLFMDNGEVSVLMNGEEVPPELSVRLAATIGSSLSCFPDKLILLAVYSIDENVQRRTFSIENVPLQIGDYEISRIETGNQVCGSDTTTSVFATSVADGDVQGDFYLPVKDENNFVSITSYNDQTEEIEGTFQITFAIELEDEPPYKNDITAPDTIRLTQGRFSAIVREN